MGEYFVQYGDTLSSIAREKLGQASRWLELASLNNIHNPWPIFVGQRLRLPEATGMQLKPIPVYTMHPPAPSLSSIYSKSLDPIPQIPATMAIARGFLFVVFEQLPEIGSGKIIRKVAVIPRDYSLMPKNPLGKLSLAEHVMDVNRYQSQFLSASNKPFGAPTIEGHPLILDVAKIQRAGGKIYSVADVVADLERFAAENPGSRTRVNSLIWTIRNIEGEVLIEGGTPPHSAARPGPVHNAFIKSAEDLFGEFKAKRLTRLQLQQELTNLEKAYSRVRIVGRVGRVLTVIGVVVTIADLTQATRRSVHQNSFRPIGAELVRQAGGWGGAIAGLKIGFAAGALFGVETGPGLFATGAVGALIFGAAGYFGADWVADHISPN